MSATRVHDVSVLYVEDDDATRTELAELLGRRVRELRVAADGAAGLAAFRAHEPDLVLSDIRMPQLDGLAMARELRALRPELPIVLTTAHSDLSYLLEAIELGADGYVLKPIALPQLTRALDRAAELVLHRRAARRHAEERERLIGELEAALARIKRLSGLLPICASCKRIRDDRGYWQQLEAYITEHSEAEFTHGLCQECVTKLYGDLVR
ncbi:MAG: response regulator [Polyangiaceae bacterium]|nr:response regulator [Polyangiaceae bacterium]